MIRIKLSSFNGLGWSVFLLLLMNIDVKTIIKRRLKIRFFWLRTLNIGPLAISCVKLQNLIRVLLLQFRTIVRYSYCLFLFHSSFFWHDVVEEEASIGYWAFNHISSLSLELQPFHFIGGHFLCHKMMKNSHQSIFHS